MAVLYHSGMTNSCDGGSHVAATRLETFRGVVSVKEINEIATEEPPSKKAKLDPSC